MLDKLLKRLARIGVIILHTIILLKIAVFILNIIHLMCTNTFYSDSICLMVNSKKIDTMIYKALFYTLITLFDLGVFYIIIAFIKNTFIDLSTF